MTAAAEAPHVQSPKTALAAVAAAPRPVADLRVFKRRTPTPGADNVAYGKHTVTINVNHSGSAIVSRPAAATCYCEDAANALIMNDACCCQQNYCIEFDTRWLLCFLEILLQGHV